MPPRRCAGRSGSRRHIPWTVEHREHVAHFGEGHVDRAGQLVVLVLRRIAHIQPQRAAAHLLGRLGERHPPQQRLAQQPVEILALQAQQLAFAERRSPWHCASPPKPALPRRRHRRSSARPAPPSRRRRDARPGSAPIPPRSSSRPRRPRGSPPRRRAVLMRAKRFRSSSMWATGNWAKAPPAQLAQRECAGDDACVAARPLAHERGLGAGRDLRPRWRRCPAPRRRTPRDRRR